MAVDRTTDDGPGGERAITLSDAVVAIAMTLLILPLVEVSGELHASDLRSFWSDNGDLVTSFVISFVVIYVFWTGHGSIFRLLTRSEVDRVPGLDLLNTLWLLCIAFLPFPTALVGQGGDHDLGTHLPRHHAGPVGADGGDVLARPPGRRRAPPQRAGLDDQRRVRGRHPGGAQPALAMYLLLLLIPIRIVEGRRERAGAATP